MATKKKTEEKTPSKTTEEMIEGAKAEANLWLDAIKFDGKYDLKKIEQELSKITYEGEPVHAIAVPSASEVPAAVMKGIEAVLTKEFGKKPTKKEVKEQYVKLVPQNCVMDYFMIAYYDCVVKQLPEHDIEFLKYSLLEACRAGLGYIVNLGGLLVGVARAEVFQDLNFRLHSENGPALIWGKKIKKYYWHGTEVPKEWILKKEDLKPEMAFNHENGELRRVLCEIMGWARILNELDAKKLQKDEFGELLEVTLPQADGPSRFVSVRCATGRDFVLPVPNNMTTAHQAVAWTYGYDNPQDYKPEVRT